MIQHKRRGRYDCLFSWSPLSVLLATFVVLVLFSFTSSAKVQYSHNKLVSRPAFIYTASIGSFFTSLLYKVEGAVAASKVNKGRDIAQPKLVVGPDSDYPESKFDHSLWDNLLQKYVSTGGTVDDVNANVVDYIGISKDPDFDKYTSLLAKADTSALPSNDLLALYINAYNALCIGHVIRYIQDNDNELPKSITKAGQGRTEVWDLPAGIVGGETVTLNDIENVILRSRWSEPRIHASIVCASASCPNLRQEAFVATRLNEQMDDQARQWISDTTKGLKFNSNDDGDNSVTLSRIFLWFKDDFTEADGGPVAWISKYVSPDVSQKLLDSAANKPIKYYAYNWNLNKM